MAEKEAIKRPKGRQGPSGVASKGTPDPPRASPESESRIQLLNERLKQQEEDIQTFKNLSETLITESTALRDECRTLKRERLQVTTALQRAADNATAEAESLKSQLQASDDRLDQQLLDSAKREGELVASASAQQASLQERVTELQNIVASLEAFKEKRAVLEAANKRFEEDNVALTQSYEEKLGEMHLRAHRLQQRVEDLEREAAEQAAAAGAADETEADPVRLLHQNRKLAAALRRSGEEVTALQQNNKDLRCQITELKTEVLVAKELENKAIETSATHLARYNAYEHRINALQDSLNAVSDARDQAKIAYDGSQLLLASAKEEIAKKEQQLNRQAQEIRHVRQIRRELLAERSEAQEFLVSSIRAVRKEVAAQREEAAALAKSAGATIKDTTCLGGRRAARIIKRTDIITKNFKNTGPLTPLSQPLAGENTSTSSACSPASSTASTITSKTSSSRSSTLAAAAASVSQRLHTAAASGKRLVDISELTWDERESVLRLLLAHVNGKSDLSEAQSMFSALQEEEESNKNDTSWYIEEETASLPELASTAPFLPEQQQQEGSV
ncbi:hypothetical protein Ndes2526B_g01743 [Nannochloris sp. 'desiccata']|nr:hypothetical protein KSW81_005772 [Chlorella desiccata (nom. nud.)]KAH7623318.1 hypothetical protein NADE_002508 [Chlorella desiccata (nom. nud.)]